MPSELELEELTTEMGYLYAEHQCNLTYAQTIAKHMAKKFYPEASNFEALPDLHGVLNQIDAMTCGLIRKPPNIITLLPEESE